MTSGTEGPTGVPPEAPGHVAQRRASDHREVRDELHGNF